MIGKEGRCAGSFLSFNFVLEVALAPSNPVCQAGHRHLVRWHHSLCTTRCPEYHATRGKLVSTTAKLTEYEFQRRPRTIVFVDQVLRMPDVLVLHLGNELLRRVELGEAETRIVLHLRGLPVTVLELDSFGISNIDVLHRGRALKTIDGKVAAAARCELHRVVEILIVEWGGLDDSHEPVFKYYLPWLVQDVELAQQVLSAWSAIVECGEADEVPCLCTLCSPELATIMLHLRQSTDEVL